MAKKGKKTVIKIDKNKLKPIEVKETPNKFYKTFEEVKIEQEIEQSSQNLDKIEQSSQNLDKIEQSSQNLDKIEQSSQNLDKIEQSSMENIYKIEQNLEIIKPDKKIEEIFLQEEIKEDEESFEEKLRKIIQLRNKDINPQFYIEEKIQEEIIEDIIKEKDCFLKNRNIFKISSKGRNKTPIKKISNKISINNSNAY